MTRSIPQFSPSPEAVRLSRRAALVFGLAAAASTLARAGSYEDYFRAVNVDDDRTVKQLLERGFDPNTVDPKGNVALYLALREPAPRVLELLLAHPQTKIDVANATGETPLMMAALRGETAWARRLIERGAQVNREGWTPLHYAACAPETAVLELLLQRDAAVNARSPNGTTPLMMASRYGSDTAVEVLLARGADPRGRNVQQLSAADFAKLGGREKLEARLRTLTPPN